MDKKNKYDCIQAGKSAVFPALCMCEGIVRKIWPLLAELGLTYTLVYCHDGFMG